MESNRTKASFRRIGAADWKLSNDFELTCVSNMLPLGREVQAERHSSLYAYRVSSKPGLGGDRVYPTLLRRRYASMRATIAARAASRSGLGPQSSEVQ